MDFDFKNGLKGKIAEEHNMGLQNIGNQLCRVMDALGSLSYRH